MALRMENVVKCATRLILAGLLTITFGASFSASVFADFLSIAAGSRVGVYHKVAAEICSIARELDVRCQIESTTGSSANLVLLSTSDVDLAIVQSDLNFEASNSAGHFADAPFANAADMRTLVSLHLEPMTVVVRKGLGMKKLADLRGHKINAGLFGSGHRATLESAMVALGWTWFDFQKAFEFAPGEQTDAICDGKIDGFVYVSGHPNNAIEESLASCDVMVVPLSDKTTRQLIANTAGIIPVTVSLGPYGWPNSIDTVAVRATLMASKDLSDNLAYQITGRLLNRLPALRQNIGAFAGLPANDTLPNDRLAPIHPGASRYFREAGLQQ